MPYIANRPIKSKYKGENREWKPGEVVLGAENWATLDTFVRLGHIRFVDRDIESLKAEIKKEIIEELKKDKPKKRIGRPPNSVNVETKIIEQESE